MRHAGFSIAVAATISAASAAAPPDFNRDVRPILAEHCFKCHGPDEGARKGKLRLDLRADAVARKAIDPSNLSHSELLKRISTLDEGELMPPADAKKPLSDAKKRVLQEWIVAGAPYADHWAFVPPKRPSPPAVKHTGWPRNAIDLFVLSKLESLGATPSAEADRSTLVRRVHLDLIGLPPTPAEARAFVDDKSPDAWERLVDRLLTSPRYGERWARKWLDLARYADTNGYEKDRVRSIWPYRDWVVDALNRDMPFDQFSIEQLAGDMLPNASPSQRIATGFHRNTMLNEEGGIDPLEFRFHAMTDRVATTATVWLGLTMQCAQCHTHKYDPIPQRDYYRMMACLNNADEPEMDVESAKTAADRRRIESQIAAMEADLPNRFPALDDWKTAVAAVRTVTSANGADPKTGRDGSIKLFGAGPDKDAYTITFEADEPVVAAIRLEALADPELPSPGPGRTPHGNFVVTEFSASVAAADGRTPARKLRFASASADAAQEGFPASNAIDGRQNTGWAIHVPGKWNVSREATFVLAEPVRIAGPAKWTIVIDQQYGGGHTLGWFRLSLVAPHAGGEPVEVRRKKRLESEFSSWIAQESRAAGKWTTLRPKSAESNSPLLTVLADGSILASGDTTKRDVYDVRCDGGSKPITAVRLEVLPDPSLPKSGPGRVWYEGVPGDFFLSEFALRADGKPIRFASASASHSNGGDQAGGAIDGSPLTGWSIGRAQGKAHSAVFRLERPVASRTLDFQLVFEKYYAAGLGRFRISTTSDVKPAGAKAYSAEIERLLSIGKASWSDTDRAAVLAAFLQATPLLSSERARIEKVRSSLPAFPTTLVMKERPSNNSRATFVHHRGEYLQPRERVSGESPSLLPPMPRGVPRNRLEFARWLVSSANPLAARAAVNRHWAAFFGRGIVRTTEDFGYQGEPPTHPELLDWLAVEFVDQGWSQKKLHRLIATSATYRQSSAVIPAQAAKDPDGRLLSRFPRTRLDAEVVRDSALRASGLLSEKMGGPSVFPPQPANVSSEGAYGPLQWRASTGSDRYRRGLYTFAKRTAPFAAFTTFDAPSGEACVARREVSNTPLQALTLLNDAAFMEAAQALGRLAADSKSAPDAAAVELFQRCLTRPPSSEELAALRRFQSARLSRFQADPKAAAALAGASSPDVAATAAWTAAARVLLNLDEAVTKQ